MKRPKPAWAAWPVVLSVLWALALPAAAVAAGRREQRPLVPRYVVAVVYGIGSLVCHQRPERSFRAASVPWPVCARCTGIYAAAATVALALPATGRLRRRAARSPAAPGTRRLVLAVAVLPAVLTLAYEWTTGDVPSNGVRAASGALLGGAVGWVVGDFVGN